MLIFVNWKFIFDSKLNLIKMKMKTNRLINKNELNFVFFILIFEIEIVEINVVEINVVFISNLSNFFFNSFNCLNNCKNQK